MLIPGNSYFPKICCLHLAVSRDLIYNLYILKPLFWHIITDKAFLVVKQFATNIFFQFLLLTEMSKLLRRLYKKWGGVTAIALTSLFIHLKILDLGS